MKTPGSKEISLASSTPRAQPVVTVDSFRETYKYEEVKRRYFKDFFIKNFLCTKRTIFNIFPILAWLKAYKIKEDLVHDLMAGLTVAVLHIPHGLAYAPLGKAEPVVGFYMAIFPVMIYVIMGTSRQISIGTFAVMCAMVGAIVSKYETAGKSYMTLENGTSVYNKSLGNSSTTIYYNIEIGTALALGVGIWQAGLGLLRLGFLTVIMSESLVAGFTTAAAVHVISLQLKNLFGVSIVTHSKIFKLYYIYEDFFNNINRINTATVIISVVCICFLLFFVRYLIPFIQKKYPTRKIIVPVELLVIILGTIFSYYFNFHGEYGVRIVSDIPMGVPAPSVPPLALLPELVLDSLVLAILGFAVNLSLAKIFAKKCGYVISNNQEFFAYGLGNIFGSFFSCLPACASLSRSSVQYATGGRTQLASFFSICIILTVIVVAGHLFEPVPYCVLSSIVVVSLVNLLLQIKELPKIFRLSYLDGILWLGTFLAVIVLDLDVGLAVGICLSLLNMLVSVWRVKVSEIGRVPDTDVFVDLQHYKAAEKIPEVLILQITGLLSYVNSLALENTIAEKFAKSLNSSPTLPPNVLLSMSGVNRIDPTSVNTIVAVYKHLIKNGGDMYICDCSTEIYNALVRCKLFDTIPREQVFPNIKEAVNYLKPTPDDT